MLSTLVALLCIASAMFLCFNPYVLASAASSLGRLATGQTGLLFQRINRTDPEKIFCTVKNNYATASLTNGQAVQWDFSGAADGLSVTRPSARATNAGFAGAGIVAETIASGGYGLVQVYGLHSTVRMREVTGGSPEAVPGSPLVMNAAGSVFCLEGMSTASTTILKFPIAIMFAATSSWTSSNKAAFIKAL